MGKPAVYLLIFILTASAAVFLPSAGAQKTIVVPDDYPTLTAAIGNATDGDTILVKAGTYQEDAIYTNKSLTITGEGAQKTVINLTSQSHTVDYNYDFWGSKLTLYDPAVEVSANNFTMSKLTVTSNGGVIKLSGDWVQLIDCSILRAFSVKGAFLDIERNIFSMGVSVNGSYSTVRGNTFADVGYGGVSFAGQYDLFTDNTGSSVGVQVFACSSYIANNRFNGSSHYFLLNGNSNVVSGNMLGHYTYGLAIGGLNNTILKNTITHCGQALLTNANNTCYANYIANNSWGLDTSGPLGGGGSGLLYNNSFVNNTYQVNTLFPTKASFLDHGKVGNYWSDYHGADMNGDGIGDTPYVVDITRSDRYPLMAPVNISAVPDLMPDWAKTAAVQLISPTEATTYSAGNITVDFVVDKQTIVSMYSLDGESNITITPNTKLPNLSAGAHNITVYSTDTYHTTGMSNTVSFTVAESFLGFSEITPAALVVIAIAIIAGSLAAFLLYRRQ